MPQNAFGGRALPGPAVGAYSAPPDTLAGFNGMGGEGIRGRKGRGKEGVKGKREGRGGEKKGKGRGGRAPRKNLWPPLPPNSGTLEPPLGSWTSGRSGPVVKYRTCNSKVADLRCAQANSASYPQPDGKCVVAVRATGRKLSVAG